MARSTSLEIVSELVANVLSVDVAIGDVVQDSDVLVVLD